MIDAEGARLIEIETARLQLRLPQPGDAETVAALVDDRTIADNTALIPHPYRRADAEAWIDQVARGEGGTALLAFADGVLVGSGGLGHRLQAQVPEVGYWIGAPFRGRGYATEIAHALVDYAFADGGYDELAAACRVTNSASRRVLEKCGFQWSGCGLMASRGAGASFPIDRFRLDRGVCRA